MSEFLERTPLPKTWRFPSEVAGWFTEAEGELLASLATGKTVLEIGAFHGRSTACLGQTADLVVSVDWHRGDDGAGFGWTFPMFLGALEKFGIHLKTIPILGRSEVIGPLLRDASFDLVFIDGTHDEASVRADSEIAFRVLRPDGWLCYHDYGDPRVMAGLTSVIGPLGEHLTVDGLLITRKPTR